MESRKRKFPQFGLERRVRARADPESDVEDEASDISSHEDENHQSEPETGSDQSDSEGFEEDESENEEAAPSVDASKISFGALARAQASLPSVKGQKQDEQSTGRGTDAREDRDSRGSKSKKLEERQHRAHKHAPTEMSAKRPVSRKREIVPVKKVQARDPRFDPLSGRLDEARATKAYAFLDEYRDDEMRQLRGEIKKAKDPRAKEELQRRLMSMESRKKAREQKERERELVEEHRRREKELVKEGKKPFYLKKSEQKKRLLMDKFSSMSGKQVEKAIEKKRKKVAGKEKKAMPFGRRGAE
ncbi:rRNA biogenesis protein RRP36 [Pleurostoma richardsiae]|uniref:rRNA biogenesis protein RRP36 n=1 Tax=Pleurostoma richardsiae TaxID=41990 RepID=A0AA38R976_9PEZI|nr:rRNA biogenesis protein RRP36 [Pleurostoma richardsiae]